MLFPFAFPSLRDLVINLIGEAKADLFAQWAFGEDYLDLSGQSFMDIWNAKHGYLYTLEMDSEIKKDITAMVKLWQTMEE